MYRKIYFLVPIILIFFKLSAIAGRPLTVDDSFLVGEDSFEIEFGFNQGKYWNDYENKSIGFTINYGIAKRCDLGISFDYIDDKNEDYRGFSTLGISLKYNFYESNKKYFPNFSVSVDFEPSNTNYGMNLIFTKEVKKLIGHLNLGYEFIGESEDKGNGFIGVAFEYQLMEKINIVGEFYEDINFELEETEDNYFTFGLTYSIIENVTFDIGYTRDIEEKELKDNITFGLTIGF